MTTEAKYIWMNGDMVEHAKATVPFLTSSLHFGTAVFEGIRCYDTPQGPAIFRLSEHMQRLIQSATILGYRQLPFTADQLSEAAKQVVRANGFRECYLRPLIFHVHSTPTLDLDKGTAVVGIAAWEFRAYLGSEAAEQGIRANVSSFTRHSPNVMMTKAKIAGNYANSTLAKTEAARLGFDEAIMLDPQGLVAECTGENLFLVRNGRIVTPPTTTILEGITRDSILTLAKDLGYAVVEQSISRDQLYIADEVFVCGTAAECIAIREIDFRPIGSGRVGPVCRAIQQAYFAAIHGQNPRSTEWLDYVTPSTREVA